MNCENMLRSAAINEAEKRRIPFIVWGSTDFEDDPESYLDKKEYIRFRDSFGGLRRKRAWYDVSEIVARARSFKAGLLIWLHPKRPFYIILDNITSPMPKGLNRLNPSLSVSFNRRNTKVIYFYDYIKYDPFLYIEVLKKEVGWQAPFGKESRMDCKLHCFGNYNYLLRHGITLDGAHLAVLVRNSLLSREEAITKEKAIQKDLIKECQQVLEELKLDIKFDLTPSNCANT